MSGMIISPSSCQMCGNRDRGLPYRGRCDSLVRLHFLLQGEFDGFTNNGTNNGGGAVVVVEPFNHFLKRMFGEVGEGFDERVRHHIAPHRIVNVPQWTHRPFDPLARGRNFLHPHLAQRMPFMDTVSFRFRFLVWFWFFIFVRLLRLYLFIYILLFKVIGGRLTTHLARAFVSYFNAKSI